MKNNERKKIIAGISLMVLAILISVGTYAYYRSTISGTVSGTILAWNCVNDGTTSSGSVNLGSLKPGSNGSFTFQIKSTNFVTDMSVQMQFANTDNVPAKLKFYENSKEGTEIALNRTGGTSSAYVTAFSDVEVAKNTYKTYTVAYDWDKTEVEEPIAAGNASNNKSLVINYKIICTQSENQ